MHGNYISKFILFFIHNGPQQRCQDDFKTEINFLNLKKKKKKCCADKKPTSSLIIWSNKVKKLRLMKNKEKQRIRELNEPSFNDFHYSIINLYIDRS